MWQKVQVNQLRSQAATRRAWAVAHRLFNDQDGAERLIEEAEDLESQADDIESSIVDEGEE